MQRCFPDAWRESWFGGGKCRAGGMGMIWPVTVSMLRAMFSRGNVLEKEIDGRKTIRSVT
jgi:hypothetical protein